MNMERTRVRQRRDRWLEMIRDVERTVFFPVQK
jgi:hypothetical protein